MAGLCEVGNEPSGFLKAICKILYDLSFEEVEKFKYLGATVTNINDTREEIKRRINMKGPGEKPLAARSRRQDQKNALALTSLDYDFRYV
ncbi:hypothetical protein ANN_09171 [Periplaneta americana]|uniref:Uncharacterized protein n=1 Tax=Periplaneta americana TaxID=6978 RepID=A0ABQ8TN39_PERAM|nr:hypothetical protein ANN_09171 [Periplaneta americana]